MNPEAALEALRKRFVARCADDLALLEGGEALPGEDLRFLVHRLAGSAGVFGYADLSVRAAAVETALLEGPVGAPLPLEPLLVALRTLLGAEPA